MGVLDPTVATSIVAGTAEFPRPNLAVASPVRIREVVLCIMIVACSRSVQTYASSVLRVRHAAKPVCAGLAQVP